MQHKKAALVIDDDNDVLEAMSESLSQLGLSVVRATSTQEAKLRLQFQKFDLVITDIALPKENGIQFIMALHKTAQDHRFPIPPIVICSGHPVAPDLELRLTKFLNVRLILGKPWDQAALESFVRSDILRERRDNPYQANVLNIFVNSVSETFELNTGTKPVLEKPQIKGVAMSLGEYTGVIQISGNTVQGAIALSFEKACLDALARKVLGDAMDSMGETSRILSDMTGEMTNQVTGRAQSLFTKHGMRFNISTPTVVIGKNHVIELRHRAPCLVLPFLWMGKRLFAEFVMIAISGATAEEEKATEVLDSGDITFF